MVSRRARLVGVDAARGAALLGMITLHALHESSAAGRPTWSYTIFSGRAAAAFAVTAGIGIAFMTGRQRVPTADRPATVATLGTRALVIGAIGLGLGEVDDVLGSVVLAYLAVAFLLAIPLVFLATRALAVIGVAMAVGMPALSYLLLPHLPDPTLENPTFGYLVDDPVALLTELSVTGLYPALPWLVYLCAGIVIGRLPLSRMRVAVGLLATGIVLAAAASATSSILLNRLGGLARIWAVQPRSGWTAAETTELLKFGGDGTTPMSTWWWLAVDTSHTSTPLDLLGTTGTAMAVLGLMLLAGRLTRPTLRRLTTVMLAPLAAAGSMPLTFYTAHVLFINSDYDIYDATTGWLAQIAAVLLVGLAWRATGGRGPVEGVVAALATAARRWAIRASRRPSHRQARTSASAPGTRAVAVDEATDQSVHPRAGEVGC